MEAYGKAPNVVQLTHHRHIPLPGKAAPAGGFRLHGLLTIRGVKLPVTPRLRQDGGRIVAEAGTDAAPSA
jgi:hypothetical protein